VSRRTWDDQFPFEFFLVTASARRARRGPEFGSQYRPRAGPPSVTSTRLTGTGLLGWFFDANSKQGAAAAKIGVWRVVKRVLFENSALTAGAEIFQLAEHVQYIRDAEFDLGLAVGSPMGRHNG